MMETAVDIAAEADIFVVVGTSLQVYPAAGLVNYVPNNIPIYIIDKKIPDTSVRSKIVAIEKGAGEGVKELKKLLLPF